MMIYVEVCIPLNSDRCLMGESIRSFVRMGPGEGANKDRVWKGESDIGSV